MVWYGDPSLMRDILKRHGGTHSGTGFLAAKSWDLVAFAGGGEKQRILLFVKKSIKSKSNVVQLFI